ERAVINDVADDAACGSSIADLQRAIRDRRAARIGAGARLDGCTGALLAERACADNRAAKGQAVRPVESQCAKIVHGGADDRTRRAAAADRQDAPIDAGRPGVAVVAGRNPRTVVVIVKGRNTWSRIADRT